MKITCIVLTIFLCISTLAFSETLDKVVNKIYSTLGAPQSEYDGGYFWYLPDYCIMILYDRNSVLMFIAYSRRDKEKLDTAEIDLFLKDKGNFRLMECRIDGDVYKSPGLIAAYLRDEGILFLMDEKKYVKKQREL